MDTPHADGPTLAQLDVEPPGVPVAAPEIYHGIVGQIVDVAAPTTEADPVGVYATVLAGVGVLCGMRPHYMVGNTRHPLLVWPLLFGRTGSGRKGEAEETARGFLRAASMEYATVRVSGLSSGEGLIERIRDPDPDNDKDSGGTDDKRLIVFEPEFASVMARARSEGSTLAHILREAWAGGALTRLNRHRYGASASHIAVVGHITPKEFRRRLDESDMTGGTYNRFLPIYVDRSKKLPMPDGVDEAVRELHGQALGRAIIRAREISRVQLDREATDLWTTDLYDEFTEADDDDQLWTEFARRAAPYCLRVAALHAVLDGRTLIGKADLVAAAALVRYSVASAKYVLGPRRDPRVDRISRALEAAGDAGVARSRIRDLFSRHLRAADLDKILQQMVEHGMCTVERVPTKGRPVEVYRAARKAR